MFGKKNTRYDSLLEEFEKGMMFGNPSTGKLTDFSSLLVCNIAIDTVRQLYTGLVDKQTFNVFRELTKEDSPILDRAYLKSSSSKLFNSIKLPCDFLKLSRMGKNSGYRFKLQNNEVGVVILLGSFFSELEVEGSHLKVELSPHFIAKRTPEAVQEYLDNIADCFLTEFKASGVAPHLCVDLQGWQIPDHMTDDIVTRSRFIKQYTGIGKIEVEGLDAVISTFNRNETVMVGKATSVQLSVYRKDLEIIKRDNVDYYNELWGNFTLGEHDPKQPTTRIESRFHHSVINQFASGINKDLSTYLAVSEHLNDLWKYSLNNIRYAQNNVVHPLWQLLHDDITFNDNDDFRQGEFKRAQVAKKDTTSITRNISMMVGNWLSIMARTGRKYSVILKELKNSPALINPLRDYFYENAIDESTYFQMLEKQLLERRIASRYAIAF